MLDIEAFDHAYTGKESVGFRIAFSDIRDKPLIKQEGFLISPGKKIITLSDKVLYNGVIQNIIRGRV